MGLDEKQLEKAVVMLNAKLLGIVCGFLCGLALFLATVFLLIKDGPHPGVHLALLSHFFPGYRVTFLGSVIGFFYGFVTGFLAGMVVGAVYNKIAVP
jgi:hypothetical protein